MSFISAERRFELLLYHISAYGVSSQLNLLEEKVMLESQMTTTNMERNGVKKK